MSDKCESCDAYLSLNKTHGQCRAAPPVPQFFGMEKVNVLGKLGMRPICGTNFPEVQKDSWCRAYKKHPEARVAFDPSKITALGEFTSLVGKHPVSNGTD